MFTRTKNGIGNSALFFKSSFIVYLECDPDCDPTQQIDISFWREFFKTKYPNMRFHFKGLGGKTQVIEMADQIISKSIHNSICVMDRDYDDFYGA